MTEPHATNSVRRVVLWLAPVLGLAFGIGLYGAHIGFAPALVAGLTLWVALWWVFEPIPIPFTSLLPLALLPLAGILTGAQVGQAYGHPLILLLLGGFMLSQAIEKSGVHQRIALGMVSALGGTGGARLVLGFMLAAAALSMWVSNSATVLMLLPIALAVLNASNDPKLAVALLLGIGYSASIGGLATPIGTPPNLIFLQAYRSATGIELSFVQYLSYTLPVVVLMLPLTWLWLTRGLRTGTSILLPSCGPWRSEERRVLLVFGLIALAWITRAEPYGGWRTWFGLPSADDASVALLGCVLLALIPSGRVGEASDRLLDWTHASRIPWGILLLFGSGIALADAFSASGLSRLIGDALGSHLVGLPLLLVVGLIALAVTFMTEVTSNTAVASLLMPLLAASAVGAGADPLPWMFAAALSASCAFMLPVATAPNAIVYSSGRISIAQMAREGLVVNLTGALVITLVVRYWVAA